MKVKFHTPRHWVKRGASLLPIVFIALILWFPLGSNAIAAGEQAPIERILPLIGDALVDIGQEKFTDAQDAFTEANQLWEGVQAENSDLAANVNSALAHANKAVAAAKDDPAAAKKALAAAAKAVNAYAKSASGKTQMTGPDAAATLIPLLEQLTTHIKEGSWSAANADYRQIDSGWKKIEQPIRGDNVIVYGSLETSMSMIRIALRSDPPRAAQAEAETAALLQQVKDYASGKIAKTAADMSLTLTDAFEVLNQAEADAKAGHAAESNGQMQAFIRMWPSVEGEVQLRSAAVYRDIENQMTEAAGYLVSEPPETEKAGEIIAGMKEQLAPILEEASYNAFDAGAILLREGFEAILVLAALISYLNKAGHADKRKWIWGGAGMGLLLSAIMALVLTYAVSQAMSGSMREKIEGISGLAAVLFMLLVGNWLHKKSNIRAWNAFIDKQVGGALARGSLWSLFVVSGLSIFREGAETAIFYVGMAASIDPMQMLLGIAVALLLLLILAVLMIKYSVKLPLRPFFLTASAFIYVLVFRFIGESIHSLQVATWVPAHSISRSISVNVLGIYPTLETVIPQAALLLYLLIRYTSVYIIGVRRGRTT
ncbi:FTR1 family protein [Paenibacillus sp. CF384]|uniref:FTR1 family iron permease n=1 Tax=Paenibacillus sp. CF384 TaxID=1884382 RepID=UPI000897A5AF|nr:FTR1 family protein [Paenibacillus sp. CF384]SDX13031.1 high-affinity iron transporter [Paenibacillus sp. CF384]